MDYGLFRKALAASLAASVGALAQFAPFLPELIGARGIAFLTAAAVAVVSFLTADRMAGFRLDDLAAAVLAVAAALDQSPPPPPPPPASPPRGAGSDRADNVVRLDLSAGAG